MKRVLLLAGAGAARRLAGQLAAAGHDVTASLAGVTAQPAAYPCALRRGGFGGVAGLTDWLRQHRTEAIVDATHPFAATISAHARAAAEAAGVPLLTVARPPWSPRPGEHWWNAPDIDAAVAMLPPGARAFAATGRKSAGLFARRSDVWTAVRIIDPPTAPFPGDGAYIVARPPFDEAAERRLFERLRITHLVVKNAGGAAGRTKLDAAAALTLPIIVVERPPAPASEALSAEDILSRLT
ncbi:MAG: cobalt-precorrin-6A reductase [Pseudomonadota bacterium]